MVYTVISEVETASSRSDSTWRRWGRKPPPLEGIVEEFKIAAYRFNCFNCGDNVWVGDAYGTNLSNRRVCVDCIDSDDRETELRYREWAEFNGVEE